MKPSRGHGSLQESKPSVPSTTTIPSEPDMTSPPDVVIASSETLGITGKTVIFPDNPVTPAATTSAVVPPTVHGSVGVAIPDSKPPSTVKIQKEVVLSIPKTVVMRIFGVTSQTIFGDHMQEYFYKSLPHYLEENFEEADVKEILESLRVQVNKELHSSKLPSIAGANQPKREVIESVIQFVMTRAEINRTSPDSKVARFAIPAYIQLKSRILKNGIEKGDITTQMYEDAASAVKTWSAAAIKLYSISSVTVDLQSTYFSKTQKGNLEGFFTGHVSTMNPNVSTSDSNRIDFREMSKMILAEKTPNVCYITDKIHEAKLAAKVDVAVILMVRDGTLGHFKVEDVTEDLEGIPVVSSFTSIVFK